VEKEVNEGGKERYSKTMLGMKITSRHDVLVVEANFRCETHLHPREQTKHMNISHRVKFPPAELHSSQAQTSSNEPSSFYEWLACIALQVYTYIARIDSFSASHLPLMVLIFKEMKEKK